MDDLDALAEALRRFDRVAVPLNGRRAAAPRQWSFLGVMIRRRPALATMLVGRLVLSRSGVKEAAVPLGEVR